MAEPATAPTAPATLNGRTNGPGPSPPIRQVRPARHLPGGRAVVGGFLVAASAVGVFAAYASATASPRHSYAVVTADIRSGDRLSASDLALVPLDLPDQLRRLSFADVGQLDGATALAPMAAGQLVQASDVAKPMGGPDRAQISLAVDPGDALGGDAALLGEGERVAVIVTYSHQGAPDTSTISRDAVVVRVLGGRDQIGSGGSLTVVLAVAPDELEPIAQAAAAGVVTLARTTGLALAPGGR